MLRHERLYTTLLVLLIVYCLCGLGILVALTLLPPDSRPPSRLPEWSFPLLAFANGAYVGATVLTLVLRYTEPVVGRRLTRGLNIALLFGPPAGTVLGLYGLWKVDRPVETVPT